MTPFVRTFFEKRCNEGTDATKMVRKMQKTVENPPKTIGTDTNDGISDVSGKRKPLHFHCSGPY